MQELYDEILREFAKECNLTEEFVFTHYHVVDYGAGEFAVEAKKEV